MFTTTLDALIAAERKKTSDRIAKLRREAAAEQRRVDTKVVELLKTRQRDLYDRLSVEARAVLDAEKAERSARAKGKASTENVDPAPEADYQVDHHDGGTRTWQG